MYVYTVNNKFSNTFRCEKQYMMDDLWSYQDDERLIMKGRVQWNPIYGWEDFASSQTNFVPEQSG